MMLARNVTLAAPTVAILCVLALTRKSDAYPADVFVAGAPLTGPALHRMTEVPSGSYSVSQQTGAAQYSFAIPVPPGRNGMSPQVALSYSSQNPLRGGVFAGWDLAIPYIEVDTTEGRLGKRRYRSWLAGGQRLVEVDEPAAASGVTAYRAESDSDYVRYEHTQTSAEDVGTWRALHPNGNTFHFGATLSSREALP